MGNGIRSALMRLTSERRRNGNGRASALLDRESFEQALVKERSRSDRRSACFTLLVIDISGAGDGERHKDATNILAGVISERTRVEDSKGFFGEHVGVILTELEPTAATEIVESIGAEFDRRVRDGQSKIGEFPELLIQVYGYPGNDEIRNFEAADELSMNGSNSSVDPNN